MFPPWWWRPVISWKYEKELKILFSVWCITYVLCMVYKMIWFLLFNWVYWMKCCIDDLIYNWHFLSLELLVCENNYDTFDTLIPLFSLMIFSANQRPVSRSRDISRPMRGLYPDHVNTLDQILMILTAMLIFLLLLELDPDFDPELDPPKDIWGWAEVSIRREELSTSLIML